MFFKIAIKAPNIWASVVRKTLTSNFIKSGHTQEVQNKLFFATKNQSLEGDGVRLIG